MDDPVPQRIACVASVDQDGHIHVSTRMVLGSRAYDVNVEVVAVRMDAVVGESKAVIGPLTTEGSVVATVASWNILPVTSQPFTPHSPQTAKTADAPMGRPDRGRVKSPRRTRRGARGSAAASPRVRILSNRRWELFPDEEM